MTDKVAYASDRLRAADREQLLADGLMTVKEAATFLRVCRSTLYTLMDNGELAFCKVGRSRRIPRRAVIELAARGLHAGGAQPGGAATGGSSPARGATD